MENLGATIAALLPRVSGNPAAMLHIARLMQQDGQRERSIALSELRGVRAAIESLPAPRRPWVPPALTLESVHQTNSPFSQF